MSDYTPDLWTIVELKFNDSEEVTRKILASWYGGYLGGDSWRLSSGITKIIDKDAHYEIHNESGSIYYCGKNNKGMSNYTTGIFEHLGRSLEEKGTIKVVNFGEDK
jgi:hypothetical protein